MKYLLVIYRDKYLNINREFVSLTALRKYIKELEIERYAIYKLVEVKRDA